MTIPRSVLVDPSVTPYYLCTSRCVRRAFLCGKDAVTGNDYDHRRAWLEKRVQELVQVFAIELCAYAIMSNHYHLLLYLNKALVEGWTDAEVVERYSRIHRIPDWFKTADPVRIANTVAVWRDRLGDLSWFMKCINEPLARLSNREDGCKGRFWEGRFDSKAILDDGAVLKSMAYVDLNPIRAQMAQTPEESDYTSIQARIEGRAQALAPFKTRSKRSQRAGKFTLPISKKEYLQLVDYTGRQLRPDKRGRIPETAPPIVERLARHTRRDWLDEMSQLSRHYFRAIGNLLSLADYRDHLGQTRLKGLRA